MYGCSINKMFVTTFNFLFQDQISIVEYLVEIFIADFENINVPFSYSLLRKTD